MKKRILIVEGDLALRKLMEFVLAKDYAVKTVENGEDAIFLLEAGEHHDMIIADIHLESKSGFELCGYLKQHPFLKKMPVILLSDQPRKQDQMKCYQVGADDVLLRPFNPIEMMFKVQRLFMRQMRRVEKSTKVKI